MKYDWFVYIIKAEQSYWGRGGGGDASESESDIR